MRKVPLWGALMTIGWSSSSNAQALRVYDQVCIDEEVAKCGAEPLRPTTGILVPAVRDRWNAWNNCVTSPKLPTGVCVRDMGAVIAKGNEDLLKAYIERVQSLLDRLEETGVVANRPTGPAGSRN